MAGSSPRVENTVGKGEIARYEQFHLFPQCFQKTCTADMLESGLVWESFKVELEESSSVTILWIDQRSSPHLSYFYNAMISCQT